MPNARETALKALYRVEFEGAYSNIALKEELSYAGMSGLDNAFTTSLVYGVISRKLTLDYIIGVYSSVKLKKLSRFVLLILRMGIYQIYFMDKVPRPAAVNESVKLANRYAKRSAGFVNGVLRNAVRKVIDLSDISDLEIRYSFPSSIYKMFERDFGMERAESLMNALNASPEMTVRVNLMKITPHELCRLIEAEGGSASVSDILPYAVIVSGIDVSKSELYKKGFYTVQDTAAMLAAAVLSPLPGQTVLDMCAAPGGKTAHLGEIMENNGKVIAFDIHEHKLRLIENNVKRAGLNCVFVRFGDARKRNKELEGIADKVLADVPCSGLGIIRRKPDIKWSYEASELCGIQLEILRNSSRYLRRGGELVYSTCTLNKQENEEVIEKFLKDSKEFEAVDISGIVPEKLEKETAKRGYITLYPDVQKTDGFFISKIRRV